jgi:tetratricopeptide (TPR) repeat protein
VRETAEPDSSQTIGETRMESLESRVETALRPKLESLNQRYAIGNLLGKGGMAVVYQVKDLASGKQVALKQFTLPKDDRHYAESASLFEHEFLTLAQLSHPRIIEVYDYSVADTGPYYTMELLDGGDLRERTPMPWRDACHVIYDICSSLALIHSRRLVHRDISPRNVRCSQDGQAKLIDFGALVPMGPGDLIVGTPQFVAPEVVYRAALDARTDLFSLGATFYYTITGRVPYPVKTFNELLDAWDTKPQPPSFLVEGIPPALDSLILSLVSTDPASRPHSAFEVMQRLAAIAGLPRAEPASVSRAYLSTPTMVGREGLVSMIAHETARAVEGRGRGVVIQGAAGLGRSRLLDATALAAKAHGSTVLRAYGGATTGESFKVARSLAERLVDTASEAAIAAARAERVTDLLFEETQPSTSEDEPVRLKIRDFSASGSARVDLQSALGRWFMAVTHRVPLVIAVDDLHRVDEPSLALLAALATQVERQRLLIVATMELDAEPTDRTAIDIFKKNSTRLSLSRLERGDVERLFISVFGDVPNVRLLSDRIDAIAEGNPRTAMDLAQHLIDRGLVRYEGGGWTLPAEIDRADLPATAEDALRGRVAALPSLSRFLSQAHALATHHAFTRDDYARVRPYVPALELDRAIGELVTAQLVVSDGRVFTIANQSVRSVLRASLVPEAFVECHRALVGLYEGRIPFGVVRHALLGKLEVRGLDALSVILAGAPERSALTEIADIDPSDMAATFEQALAATERLGRPPREAYELRRWLVSLSIVAGHAHFANAAPAWLARLELDSGYADWKAHPEITAPADRLSNAMQLAYGRYMATPEAERVYRPDEAIAGMVRYVALGIAIGSNRIDTALIESLPALLEPFAAINELVQIVWQNALAARELTCRVSPERGRALWMQVYERLGNITGADAQYATLIRNAVAFGLGACEAWMGMESATQWAERLDDDPLQRVSALQLRRTVRMQLGDWEGAEKLRKEAEVLGLQTRSLQMFTNVTQVEVNACAMAGDLTGLKQCIDRVRALAEQMPGWIPTLRLAEGRFQLLCGNVEAALELVEGALGLLEGATGPAFPLNSAWCGSVAGRVEALTALERHAEAQSVAETALSVCERLEIGAPAHDISRALALVEARLGHFEKAAERLSRLLEHQRELGISGLRLGASYEARARVAIAAKDTVRADEYMRLTAREYRYGHGSALGARYERLLQEAQLTAGARLPALSDFESGLGSGPTSATVVVTQAMKGAGGATERAGRALDLLCDERAAAVGHLYLFKGRGLKLAASRGALSPPKDFSAFIQRFIMRELTDRQAPTQIVSDTSGPTETGDTHFTDARGLNYYPFLLRGVVGKGLRYTGVVALVLEERPEPPDENLIVAVSTHFILSGDTSGIEYGAWPPVPKT